MKSKVYAVTPAKDNINQTSYQKPNVTVPQFGSPGVNVNNDHVQSAIASVVRAMPPDSSPFEVDDPNPSSVHNQDVLDKFATPEHLGLNDTNETRKKLKDPNNRPLKRTLSARLVRSHTKTLEYLQTTKAHQFFKVLCICCFKVQSFCSNKHRDFGMTWCESFMRIWQSLTHKTINFCTMIFAIVMLIVTGLTALVNFHVPFVVGSISCIIGLLSLVFEILLGVLVFDIISIIGGFAITFNAIWRSQSINMSDSQTATNTTEMIYGIIFFVSFPFRVTWWKKYYPNVFQAIDFHDQLMFKHLNITAETLKSKNDVKVAMYQASQLLHDIDD